MTHDIVDHIRVTQKLLDSETSFVSVTLCAIRGSAPQIVGAKAIVTVDGIECGTIGGGKIEAAAIRRGQEMLTGGDQPSCELQTWNLQSDIGMTCGGEVTLLFEHHSRSNWPIVVFGAGHVAQALIRLLVQLNCRVTCIDSRSDWLAKLPYHPKLKKECVAVPKSVVASHPADAFFVLVSKGHATDLPVLAEILSSRDAPYVGVIGSEQKARVLRRDLHRQGFADDKIDAFFCPMGLPIGNNTPTEIAISIVAQLIRVRDETKSD